MAKHLKEVEVKLENPVEIAKDGMVQESDVVLMRAPSMNCRKQVAKIKNICGQVEQQIGMMARGQNNEAPEPKEESEKVEKTKEEKDPLKEARAYVNLLNVVEFDFDTVEQSFTHVLTIGNCGYIDGEKLTKPIIDDLSFADFEILFGVYVNSFLS
jgi:hypothetical protein